MKRFRELFFLILGILSIVYYIVCVAYAWLGVSWLWIWPLLSAFCAVRYIMLKKNVRVPKAIRIIYSIAVAAFLAVFIFVEAQIVGAMTNTVPEKNLDYIITLGAAVRDGKPVSPLRMRIERTIEYMSDNPDTILIASGGQGPAESMSEAECIREYVSAAGIDPGRIIIEDKSTDTFENIRNSYEFIPEGASVGLVTSSFHIYRAMVIARQQGHEVSGVPARSLLPLGIHYTVREFFGIVKLMLINLR